MCGLFGYVKYGKAKTKDLSTLTSELGREAAIRGTDATGIAYCEKGCINVLKTSKPAYAIDFEHPADIKALIGHTRHTTQGSQFKNCNNHPFHGKNRDGRTFALAHNGVLTNDHTLRKQMHLPKTKIETDSFIAVQLLEQERYLDANSLKRMAEKIEGSFSFSVLDEHNNIYLIKGDSPLSVYHFPTEQIYVYASTPNILFSALIRTSLFASLQAGEFREAPITEGDILKLCSDGRLEYAKFNYKKQSSYGWWDYNFSFLEPADHISSIKSVASGFGYSPEEIDILINHGYSPEEIEEFLYCGGEV